MERAPASIYRTTRLATSDLRRQVLGLYDRSIRLSRQAVALLRSEDMAGAAETICESYHCVGELQSVLNFPKGEEIAVNLWRLYEFARESLEAAYAELDGAPLEDALFVLETLREGWRQLLRSKPGHGDRSIRTYREPIQSGIHC